MLRPINKIGRRISFERKSKELVRNKVVQPASILKPAEKLKLYNKENKELFGPLLETNKQRKRRIQKEGNTLLATLELQLSKYVTGMRNKESQSVHITCILRLTCCLHCLSSYVTRCQLKSYDSRELAPRNTHVISVAAKNTSHQNNRQRSENTSKFFDSNALSKRVFTCVNYSPFEVLKKTMWQNTRHCVNIVGVLFNNAAVRGLKTSAVCEAVRSSPAQPGYASEDKILQIKPHRNDFAEQYPSVTLILNKTMTEESRAALEKWKQERIAEMGLEEFNRFYQAQMAVGTKFHNTLKNYFTQPRTQLRIEKDVESVWVSVAEVLKSISSPKAIESNVVHPVLKYRGIFDAIADYEDKPTLIEWKKSDKPRKSISLTYDNPVQLAAYFGAVCNDLNYKHFNVRDALLVIAYTDGSKADAYHLSTDKLREHWAQWLIRLEEYSKKFGNNSEKMLKGGKRMFEEELANL